MADDLPPLPAGAKYVDAASPAPAAAKSVEGAPPLPPGATLVGDDHSTLTIPVGEKKPSLMEGVASGMMTAGSLGAVPMMPEDVKPEEVSKANLDFGTGLAAGAAENVTGVGEMLPGPIGRASARGTQALEQTGNKTARQIGYYGGQLAPAAKIAGLAGKGIEALSGGRSLATDIMGGATTGLVSGAAAPTGKEDDSARAKDKSWDAIAGALLGGAIPAGAQGLRRLISPNEAPSAERQALIDTLKQEGVDLTAGQELGSRPLRWLESHLGDVPGAGHVAANIEREQQEQFTRAVMRRTGADELATPENIDRAFTRIGGEFNKIGQNATLNLDQQFGQDIVDAIQEYGSIVNPSDRAPVFTNTLRDVVQQMQNHAALDGKAYLALRSRLGKAASSALRGSRSDPELAQALFGIQGALDGALERSVTPAEAQALRTARRQYANLLPIAKASAAAGEGAAQGLISPSQIRQQVRSQDWRKYARGKGDLAQVARAGEGILKPMPQSGTTPRAWAQHVLSALAGAGGAAGYGAAGPIGATMGAASALGGPAVVGRILMSKPFQDYLRNQVAAGAIDADTLALLQGAMGEPMRDESRHVIRKDQ